MTDENTERPSDGDGHKMEKRDGEIYVALGVFIVAVGSPVVAGTYWAYQTNVRAAVVNVVCGVVLLLIGAGSMLYGRMLLARNRRRT